MLKQWEKRIIIFQYIYSWLMKENFSIEDVSEDVSKDKDIYGILTYSINEFEKIKNLILKNINKNWSWERVADVDKAILISAYSEYHFSKIDRKIIIDQWIITCKNYSDENSYKFINYILDRILDAEI